MRAGSRVVDDGVESGTDGVFVSELTGASGFGMGWLAGGVVSVGFGGAGSAADPEGGGGGGCANATCSPNVVSALTAATMEIAGKLRLRATNQEQRRTGSPT